MTNPARIRVTNRLRGAVMITVVLTVLLFSAPAYAGAHSLRGHQMFVLEEVQRVLASGGDQEVGVITFDEARKIADQISIAAQKDAFVRVSFSSSMLLPGAGQFLNKSVPLGVVFLGSHLAILGASMGISYALLPADLRADQLDYYRSSRTVIEAAWKSHSFADLLPSMAVMVAGHVVDLVIRGIAAWNARSLALRSIREGRITFQPLLSFGGSPAAGVTAGIGVAARY